MKLYLFIVLVLAAMATRGQQLPTQVQAKRGVFTERLFLGDRWIDRIATSVSSTYDSSDNVLPTTKAMADFFRLHSLQLAPVTADGDYTHNWNHKNLHIDSINRLQFEEFETDNTFFPGFTPMIHNTFRMQPGFLGDSAINMISVMRNVDNSMDSMTGHLNIFPGGVSLRTENDQGICIADLGSNSISLTAVHPDDFPQFSQISVSPQGLELNNTYGNISMQGLRHEDDTANFKPVGYDNTTGKLVSMGSWPGVYVKDTNYVPVFTAVKNINTVLFDNSGTFSAMRIGNIVTVSGQITVTADSASGAKTSFEMSLPWFPVLVGSGTVYGIAFNSDYQVSAQITGGAADGKALFTFASPTTNPVNFSYSFQYRVVTITIINPDRPAPL